MKREFRAVLFDLDGTLADTLADLANATNRALAALGCPTHPLAAYRYFVGDGARELCLRALPADSQHLADDVLRLMRAHYDAHCFDETRLYPGIPELVAALHQRRLKLAVLSNKPDEFTKRMIAHYFQPSPFDVVRGQTPNVPLKPDPTAALQIARNLASARPMAVSRRHEHRYAHRARRRNVRRRRAVGFSRPRRIGRERRGAHHGHARELTSCRLLALQRRKDAPHLRNAPLLN